MFHTRCIKGSSGCSSSSYMITCSGLYIILKTVIIFKVLLLLCVELVFYKCTSIYLPRSDGESESTAVGPLELSTYDKSFRNLTNSLIWIKMANLTSITIMYWLLLPFFNILTHYISNIVLLNRASCKRTWPQFINNCKRSSFNKVSLSIYYII